MVNSENDLKTPPRFGASKRTRQQRYALVVAVKGLALACLMVVLLIFQPPWWWAELLKWVLAGVLGWGLWRAQGHALLDSLNHRHMILHEHAIEVNRSGFRRFIVFESLRHIQVLQDPYERLIALVLHTADDTVILRDLDGLSEALQALGASKPPSVFIEVEEKRFDWGEPLPWAVAVAILAFGLGLLFWSAPWTKQAFVSGDGRFLVLNGAMLVLWRPASRGSRWYKQTPEVVIGMVFVLLGQLFLR